MTHEIKQIPILWQTWMPLHFSAWMAFLGTTPAYHLAAHHAAFSASAFCKLQLILRWLRNARAFVNNIRKRGAKAFPIDLSTLSASIAASDFSIFNADSEYLKLDAILVRDVGISFSLETISFKFDLLRAFENSIIVMNRPTAIPNAANKFFSRI